MINSKVNFYFYKKGNQNNIKHIERYHWVSFKWSLTLQRMSPKGIGRLVYGLGHRLRWKEGESRRPNNHRLMPDTKPSSSNSNPTEGQIVPRKGHGGVAVEREVADCDTFQMEIRDGWAWNLKWIFWLLLCLCWPVDLQTWLQGRCQILASGAFLVRNSSSHKQRPQLVSPPSEVTRPGIEGFPT